MAEYFAETVSFAAPFFSDTDTRFVEAESPEEAMKKVVAEYDHPCGLYAAGLWASADAFHKRERKLAAWLCNHEIAKMRLTENLGGYSYLGHGPGRFEINGTMHIVQDPKGGQLVSEAQP